MGLGFGRLHQYVQLGLLHANLLTFHIILNIHHHKFNVQDLFIIMFVNIRMKLTKLLEVSVIEFWPR